MYHVGQGHAIAEDHIDRLEQSPVMPDKETAAAFLELRDLVQVFGGRTVLALDHWAVRAGQHWLVLGTSGSAKTTLLNLIAGLLAPTRGTIRIAGEELGRLPPARRDELRGRKLGIVMQNFHLINALSARDNLRLARSLAGLAPDGARIEGLLDELGLAFLADAYPARLSQGERQRVAIARAVINQPELILADEPTSALDDDNCAAVLDLLLARAEALGASLVIATHDARLRSSFTHRLELPVRP